MLPNKSKAYQSPQALLIDLLRLVHLLQKRNEKKKEKKKKGNEKKITLSEALAKAYTDSSNHTFIYSTGRGHSTNKINYNFFLVEQNT